MATKQAKKKATRKTAQPAKAPRKAARKTVTKAVEKTAAAIEEVKKGKASAKAGNSEPKAKAAPRKRKVKLDKKKLGEMVDKMLMQLAEQVEEGECKITTSEGVRLIQLREALGLDRPSTVKVEWVEPKSE